MSTSVVLLAYKEAENLQVLLPRIQEVLRKMDEPGEILVIDSNIPTDRTPEVCRQFDVRYIAQEEPFYAGAFRTGIKYASMEKIQVLDADGSHDPNDMPAIRDKFDQGYDLVIGSRYVQGGVTKDRKLSILMSKVLNAVMRAAIGVKAKDISTSYRLYDAAQLKAVILKRNNYDVLQEVLLRMKINNRAFRIGEVPIEFNKRMFGESKRRLLKFIGGYVVTVFTLLFIRICGKDSPHSPGFL